MVPADNDDDEWKVVTKSDKKRVMRKGGRNSQKARQHISVQTVLEDPATLRKALAECQRCLQETKTFQSLLDALKSSPVFLEEERNEVQIVCYGVGNFSHTSATHFSGPLWQLAAAECLRERFTKSYGNHAMIRFFDPCSTAAEIAFLRNELQVLVPTQNDQGHHAVDAGVATVFFMPHCPMALYENVVWENWNCLTSDGDVVVVGNSLLDIAGALHRTIPCPSLEAIAPFTRQTPLILGSKQEQKKMPGNFLGAFNDTYITTFVEKDGFPERPSQLSRSPDEQDKELL